MARHLKILIHINVYSSSCISIPSVWTLPETGMADADLHQCSGQESREQSVNY